jgi:hypothetical protein
MEYSRRGKINAARLRGPDDQFSSADFLPLVFFEEFFPVRPAQRQNDVVKLLKVAAYY